MWIWATLLWFSQQILPALLALTQWFLRVWARSEDVQELLCWILGDNPNAAFVVRIEARLQSMQ